MNCKKSNLEGSISMIRLIIIEISIKFNGNDRISITDTDTYKLCTSNPKVAKVPVLFQSDMIKQKESFMSNFTVMRKFRKGRGEIKK